MAHEYKTKIAHLLDNGNKLEFEAWVSADDHNAAVAKATAEFQAAVATLTKAGRISIDKTKVELGAHKH